MAYFFIKQWRLDKISDGYGCREPTSSWSEDIYICEDIYIEYKSKDEKIYVLPNRKVSSTPTFLHLDLYLNTAQTVHYVYYTFKHIQNF